MFSWKGLAIALFLWWLTGSMGIGMCYHRLLTHRGYKTPRWMEYFMAVCGTMALEGGPIAWVATHRIHHQNTDKEGDPIHLTTAAYGLTSDGSSLARPCIATPPSYCRMFQTCGSRNFICGSANIIGCRWREAASFYTPSAGGLAYCGAFFAHGSRPARDLAGELRNAYVGFTAFHHRRFVHQQFLGGRTDLWRRLAQQSPCIAAIGASRPGLVRSGHELVRDFRTSGAGLGLGHQDPEIATSFRT